MITPKMQKLVAGGSVIRAMFEEGRLMAAKYGAENVYDFSLGNPNTPPPASVREAIIDILNEEPELMVHGYMSNVGYEDVRAGLAKDINDVQGTDLTARNIVMTVGAAGALNVVMKTILEPGDEVLLQAPFFGEYLNYISNFDANAVIIPPEFKTFSINFEALEQAVTPKTKAMILNTPNNPTGAIYSEADIIRLCDLLKVKEKEYGHAIYLISDEPYREIVFAGVDAPCVSKFYDNTIMCYSFSKSLSLPGERIGYVAINPACKDAEDMIVMCGQISRGIGHNCPPSIIQLAVADVLDKTADLSVYETNMNLIYDCLVELGFTVVKPGGTFYIFPKALEPDAVSFCNKAKKYDLILVPADNFGAPGFFRMAYCISTEKVKRSLEALRKFVTEEYAK